MTVEDHGKAAFLRFKPGAKPGANIILLCIFDATDRLSDGKSLHEGYQGTFKQGRWEIRRELQELLEKRIIR